MHPLAESRRPRLLLMAYACAPGRGSEPGIGWHRALGAAQTCDTTAIVEEREFAAAIRRYLAEHGEIPGLKFVFVPLSPWEAKLVKLPGMFFAANRGWQRRAFAVAQKLHGERPFDVVHQVTLGSFREPGETWRLNAPFIWGPWGGTQNYPLRFLGRAGVAAAAFELLRSAGNWWQLRFQRRVRAAADRAAVVLAANSTNRDDFARVHGVTPDVFPDTGVDDRPAVVRPPQGERRSLRLLWSGLCEPRKALHLLIEALSRLGDETEWELRVLGDGPWKKRWQRLAERRGVADRIHWLGWRPQAETLEHYAWADAFAFTSLRDTTGTVIFEAMAAGLPVIGLDHQGLRDAVTADCGVKVAVTNARETIAQLSQAVARLAADPEACRRLGDNACRRAERYRWSSQAQRLGAIYRRCAWGAEAAASVIDGFSRDAETERSVSVRERLVDKCVVVG